MSCIAPLAFAMAIVPGYPGATKPAAPTAPDQAITERMGMQMAMSASNRKNRLQARHWCGAHNDVRRHKRSSDLFSEHMRSGRALKSMEVKIYLT